MNKTAVIYKTSNGHTKAYAEYISQNIESDIFEVSDIKNKDLSEYNTIIFGSPIYAGMIKGAKEYKKIVSKYGDKNLILFVVGMSDPEDKEYWEKTLEANFKDSDVEEKSMLFLLQGGVNVDKLGFFSKKIINSILNKTKSKPQLTENDKNFIEMVEGHKEMDVNSAKPMIIYLKSL